MMRIEIRMEMKIGKHTIQWALTIPPKKKLSFEISESTCAQYSGRTNPTHANARTHNFEPIRECHDSFL